MKAFPFLYLFLLFSSSLFAQAPVGEWYFTPQYALPGKAKVFSGPIIPNPVNAPATLSYASPEIIYNNEDPTERLTDLLDENKIPKEQFTVELWINYHVNTPVGVLVSCRSIETNKKPNWLLGYYNHEIVFSLNADSVYSIAVKAGRKEAFKNYWHHLAGTYNGNSIKLYHNGVLKKEVTVTNRLAGETDAKIELAAYLKREPYMKNENLVRALRIYDYSLSEDQIKNNLAGFQNQVEKGIIYPGIFHFNVAPYLQYATQNSINLTWETDRPALVTIEYGKRLPLTEKLSINPIDLNQEKSYSEKLIQEATFADLESGTTYFYNVKAVSNEGERIESGILTFATAVEEHMPFTFALIGDTEARPHINNHVAKLIWDERPNFVLNVGDLTDGGTKDHKFEWNYEYFAGMNQLHSRIPVYPVPGNGEDDLIWYKKYHKLPMDEDFYSFKYGNAEFFMLNSNLKSEFAPGGRQYEWLKSALQKSTAKWKFVAHHFAPYSSDEDDYGNSWEGPSDLGDIKIRKIVPLYEEFGVDMVFYGHLHTYTRTDPIRDAKVNKASGVVYIQTGGAGGNLEDFAPTRAWFSAKTYRGHHYCTVSIVDNHLSFKMYDLEGRMRDFLEMSKN